MYRASLGTRGETRRAAAEAETALVGRVRRWKRVVKPAELAPHVIIEQWERGERPPPSPRAPSPRAPTTPPAPEAAKVMEKENAPAGENADAEMADVTPATAAAPADEAEILPAAAAGGAGDVGATGADAAAGGEAAANPPSVDRATPEAEGAVAPEGTVPDSVAPSGAGATADVQMDVAEGDMAAADEQMGALDNVMGEAVGEGQMGVASPDSVATPADAPAEADNGMGLNASAEVPGSLPADVPADAPADVSADVPPDVSVDVPTDIPVGITADVPADMSNELSGENIAAAVPDGLPTGPSLDEGDEMELENNTEAAVGMDFQEEVAPLPSISDVVNPPDIAPISAELPSIGDVVNPTAIATEASGLPSLPSMDDGNLPDMNAMPNEADDPADPSNVAGSGDPLDPDALEQ